MNSEEQNNKIFTPGGPQGQETRKACGRSTEAG